MNRAKVHLKGFTLIEVLIAVGAVSLIAIGLAKVFSSTGETVRAGRRLSNLNEYASLIERQLRDDVASMSREGFMVMSHRVATDDAGMPVAVRLTADQRTQFARPRRVDQLMFFASGRFSTLRDPIHPSRVPTSTAARIYYGHALSNDPADSNAPGIADFSEATPFQPGFGLPGPNEFAADWTLVRHVTPLTDPLATDQQSLPASVSEPNANEVPDNDIQVGLQPAASSIFRIHAIAEPVVHPGDARLVRDGDGTLKPQFSSGLIDLATTNVDEIRQIVLDAQEYTDPPAPWDPAADAAQDGAGNPYAYQRDAGPINSASNPANVTSNMKRWMIGAFPAGWPDALDLRPERRMRAEPVPPNLLGVRGTPNQWPNNEPWRRADQMMLAASNFVPHCTEFIVEWSFGKVERDQGDDRYGQILWHGIDRYQDPTGNTGPLVATPYIGADTDYRYFQRIQLQSGQTVFRGINNSLIHFPPIIDPPPGAPFYSCFGYIDPTFPNTGASPDQTAYPFPQTIPWAWPTLLRITISLVDPTDPLREQTFQFIIELPEARRDRF